jgi:hypothetical protein
VPTTNVIFCQSCYELTHDVVKSVNEVNIHGGCSRCGSTSVLDYDVLEKSLKPQRLTVSTTALQSRSDEKPKRKVSHNTDFILKEDIIGFLERNNCLDEVQWWDGSYFEWHNYFVMGRENRTFEILLENRDGSQKFVTFGVLLAKV